MTAPAQQQPRQNLPADWERVGGPVFEQLQVALTDDELRDLGLDLAATLQDIAAQEREEETLRKEQRAKAARLEAKRDELALALRRRHAMRDVEILVERNYQLGLTRKIRTDTGAVVVSRLMRDEERQPPLELDVAEKAQDAMAVSSEPGA